MACCSPDLGCYERRAGDSPEMHHVTPLQPGSGSAVPSCPSTPRPLLSSYQLIWPRGELALDFQKIMRPSPLRVCRREGAVPLSSWEPLFWGSGCFTVCSQCRAKVSLQHAGRRHRGRILSQNFPQLATGPQENVMMSFSSGSQRTGEAARWASVWPMLRFHVKGRLDLTGTGAPYALEHIVLLAT